MSAVRKSFLSALAAVVAVVTGVALAAPAAAAPSPSAPVVINEVFGGGNSGAPYDRDYVELYNPGTGAIDITGWAVQYASSTGTTWQTTPLSGSIAPGQHYLVGLGFGANLAAPDLPTPNASGTTAVSGTGGKVALTNFTGALGGCGTNCSDEAIVVDFVGWGSTADDFAGAGAAPATSNTTSISRNATHTNTANNAVDFTAGAPAPQNSDPVDPGTGGDFTIAEIQGTGVASPLVGQTVTTTGVVTAAYPTGGYSGYVIQTAGTGGAIDFATHTASDAIFVFSSATVGLIAVGDHVEVTGVVSEFAGLTEITVAASGGVTLIPTPANVTPATAPWPATTAQREVLESMLYDAGDNWTVSNNFTTNSFGEVGLAAGDHPLLTPTEVGAPGSAEYTAQVADNAARAVTLDDGASINFLSAANQSLTPPYLSLTSPVRVGAAVDFQLPVIVDYRNNAWKLSPTSHYVAGAPTPPAVFENDRTASPDDVGGDISVASFNVLNYFTTLGDSAVGCTSFNDRTGDPVTVNNCPGTGPRGAWEAEDLARQQVKIVEAINALDADVVGLLEIENSALVDGNPDEALATLVDALNADAGAGTWAYVPSSTELPATALQDVITNALIYRPAAVERVGDSRALGTESEEPLGAFQNAREPIGQEFVSTEGGDSIFVAVNHFKSKSSAGPWPGDADTGDGQGASNESRERQAEALSAWVDSITDEGDAVALIGDFNSYTMEDPLQLLYADGYTNAVAALAPGQYSYSFQGQSGSLDHVLLDEEALGRATGADVWEINAEEALALEYSRYNYHGTLFYDDDVYRSSDHDPVIVGLEDGLLGPIDLTFLHFNDFHGRIGVPPDTDTVRFAGTIEEQRAQAAAAGGASVLLSGGDNIGASLFYSAVFQDKPTLDVLDALELDASAVGNHEFDQGFADLTDRVIPDVDFPYLGANVYLDGTETPALQEYALIEVEGVTVGVIGVVTSETPTLVSPGGVAMLDFGDPVEAVNRVADDLTDGDAANGEADVVVAEFHEGAEGVTSTTTLEQALAANEVFAHIVNDTSADVDVIFNGHTHQAYAFQAPVPGVAGETRPVVQSGNYGQNLGKVVMSYDRDDDEVLSTTASVIGLTTTPNATLLATYPRVVAVQQIVAAAIAEGAVVGAQPVGSVAADITTAYSGGAYTGPGGTYVGGTRDNRAAESTLGGLVANALLDTLDDPQYGGATIGVTNPGGLRAELFYAPNGVITYAEANAVLPFANNLWTTTLTGAQFLEMLEQQWQTNPGGPTPSRPYLQLGLSSNVTYTFDPAAPQGSHITSVTIDGQPLDPAAEYRIGTFSFLAQGGDNFRAFTGGTDVQDTGLVDRDAWIAFLQANPNLSPDFARQAVQVPQVPTTAEAGQTLTFPVAGLDLTSLGSPLNTSLDIRLDGVSIGSVPVTGGAATVSATIPAGTSPGAHVLTLVAAPSGTTVTLPITVEQPLPESETSLTTNRTTLKAGTGQQAKLTATVEVGGQPASGQVEFVVDGAVVATVALNSSGIARYDLTATAAASSREVVARYLGTSEVAASESAPLTIVTERVKVRLDLGATQSTQRQNAIIPTIFIATAVPDAFALPDGTVEIREGDTVITRVRMIAGVVGLATLPRGQSVGTHQYTAVFIPSDPAKFDGATSAPVTVTITR